MPSNQAVIVDFSFCEGFWMPAMVTSPRALGRRSKASREGTRERWTAKLQRALWGFGRSGLCGGNGIGGWLSITAVGEPPERGGAQRLRAMPAA
jgi:hypothetical protein